MNPGATQKERVLILCPSMFGYEYRMRDAVARAGYEISLMDERMSNSFFSKAVLRTGLIRFAPWLLREHLIAIKQEIARFRPHILLLLVPEAIRGKQLRQLKAVAPDMRIIIYTWDSMSQKLIDDISIDLADAAFSFDPVDCDNHPRLRHLPLFHSFEQSGSGDVENKIYDFSLVGTIRLRRLLTLTRLGHRLHKQGRSFHFYLLTKSWLHQIFYTIVGKLYSFPGTISRQPVPYEDYKKILAQSRCVVDVEFSRQTGLTMRTFEVIFSGNALLTTNRHISRYDLVDKGGIFILDESNIEPPAQELLIAKIDPELFDKYSIDRWARNLLGLENDTYYRDQS